MRNFILTAASVAATAFMATAAVASPVAPGTYAIENAQVDGDGSGAHGVYIPNFLGGGTYDSYRWSIEDGSATVTNSSLTFSADLTSAYAASHGIVGGFTLDAALSAVADPARNYPECQNNACSHLSNDDVSYFNADGVFATLTGTGAFAGWVLDLTVNDVNGTKPPQLGLGGSWFAANTALEGFATWLTWSASSTGSGNYNTSGGGDINWLLGDLDPNGGSGGPGPSPVPLPAGGLLLIAGLGGLAAVARRKAAAA